MQLDRKTRRQAGDTLIEVLLAFSIFGIAAVAISRTMNEGFSNMFVSGQQSQVQSLMRGQLAIVQAAHDAEVRDIHSTAWNDIITSIAADPTGNVNADGCTYSKDKRRLYFLTEKNGQWMIPGSGSPFPADQAVSTTGETPKPEGGTSLWLEGKYTPPDTINRSRGYYDFYAKACWSDGSVNRQLKTVLRLYEVEALPGEGSP